MADNIGGETKPLQGAISTKCPVNAIRTPQHPTTEEWRLLSCRVWYGPCHRPRGDPAARSVCDPSVQSVARIWQSSMSWVGWIITIIINAQVQLRACLCLQIYYRRQKIWVFNYIDINTVQQFNTLLRSYLRVAVLLSGVARGGFGVQTPPPLWKKCVFFTA